MGKFERNDAKRGGGGSKAGGKVGHGGKGGKSKGGEPHKGKPSFKKGGDAPQQRKKVEITFDPTGRREYLTGFSARKKERRAFGLAMQKVKDREAKLVERKEQREAQLEKIEDIERNKKALQAGLLSSRDDDHDGDDNDYPENNRARLSADGNGGETRTFQDERFGASVSVTTTFGIPIDDDDDELDKRKFYARKEHGPGHIDEAQKKAGNVENYISSVKGIMGSNKKKTKTGGGKKGQHGASTMKGMGNASTLKMAQKTLAKFSKKGGKGGRGDEERSRGGSSGGKGKKGKGRR
jgi:ribosomal RNA-processing protein 17